MTNYGHEIKYLAIQNPFWIQEENVPEVPPLGSKEKKRTENISIKYRQYG